MRHFPRDNVASCFDLEGQKTQPGGISAAETKPNPGELAPPFFLPIYSKLAHFISAPALVNCLEDNMGGNTRRADENRRREILFELIAANAPRARRQTGNAGTRRPPAGEREAEILRLPMSGQERAYFPPWGPFLKCLFPPFHDLSLKKGLIMGCL